MSRLYSEVLSWAMVLEWTTVFSSARVVERERKFIEQQELRRETQAKITDVQKKIKVKMTCPSAVLSVAELSGNPRGAGEDPPRRGPVPGPGHSGASGLTISDDVVTLITLIY